MLSGAQLGGTNALVARDVGEVGNEINQLNDVGVEQQRLIDELFGLLDPILSKNLNDANGKTQSPESMLVPLASEIRNNRKTFEVSNSRLRDIISSIRL